MTVKSIGASALRGLLHFGHPLAGIAGFMLEQIIDQVPVANGDGYTVQRPVGKQ
jgi:hypothetical protein